MCAHKTNFCDEITPLSGKLFQIHMCLLDLIKKVQFLPPGLYNFKALYPLTILFLTHGVLVIFAPFLMNFPLICYILDFEEKSFVAMETDSVALEALWGVALKWV